MDMKLSGRTALATGASAGIGTDVAEALAREPEEFAGTTLISCRPRPSLVARSWFARECLRAARYFPTGAGS